MTRLTGIFMLSLMLAAVLGLAACDRPASRAAGAKTAFAPVVRMNPDRVYYEYFNPSGERHTFEKDQGRILLLLFWATWAQPSRELLIWLSDLERQYRSFGLVVTAFALDNDTAAVEAFTRQHQISFACPVIPQGLWTASDRPLEGLPTLYVVNRQGKIYRRYEGLRARDRLEDDILSLLQKKE